MKKSAEIRSEEKSNGGLSYEVILEDSEPKVPMRIKPHVLTSKSVTSAEEIEQKLKAAEERRSSMKEKKLSRASFRQDRAKETIKIIKKTEEERLLEKNKRAEEKLKMAELLREENRKKKMEILKEQESRAESVRQKKALSLPPQSLCDEDGLMGLQAENKE